MKNKDEEELIAVSVAWDRAMVANDANAIGSFMSPDWTVVGSDGNIVERATFLALIAAGTLSHDVMESADFDVRVYDDAAVVIARAVSGGTYSGQAFREYERVSCVFVKQEGQWRCVLTHLSRLAAEGNS